jgi:cytochrome c-type biogenesis protein CcmH/NrfF
MKITALFLLVATVQSAPQSTGPEHAAYDPSGVYTHSHDGELGAKLRVLEESLRCTCGCTLDVHTCQLNMQCGVSPVWSARILTLLDQGASEEEVLADFVGEYGKAVLIAPPLEGFNWVGYLTPAAALLMGGALVGLLLRRGLRSPTSEPQTAVSSEEWDRLQAEIRKIEEEETASDW